MMYILIIVFLLYLTVMGWISTGILRLRYFNGSTAVSKTRFTVIVPFRNEAENIPRLLRSIAALEYPTELFEVILVNDASEDASVAVVSENLPDTKCDLKIIQNKRTSASPKKDAITTAIGESKYEWILTTDADCELPGKWLQLYDQFIQKNRAKMVCAPVVYPVSKNLLKNFQFLDGLSLQAVTMGGFGWNAPLLCNGANMGYLKEAYYAVKGYDGNDHIASGDDIFLMEKIRELYPEALKFINNRDARVITMPENTWSGVVSQRIRWASKTSYQKGWGSKILGIAVFLANLAFLASILGVIVHTEYYIWYIGFLFLKIGFDLLILLPVTHFFESSISLPGYFINALLYPFITVWIVFASFFGNYQWKGRKFKK
jgi:cellulose synthase/poly-beta-1,6-N-acetylglucosamine synthase-like glycosyltransferase